MAAGLRPWGQAAPRCLSAGAFQPLFLSSCGSLMCRCFPCFPPPPVLVAPCNPLCLCLNGVGRFIPLIPYPYGAFPCRQAAAQVLPCHYWCHPACGRAANKTALFPEHVPMLLISRAAPCCTHIPVHLQPPLTRLNLCCRVSTKLGPARWGVGHRQGMRILRPTLLRLRTDEQDGPGCDGSADAMCENGGISSSCGVETEKQQRSLFRPCNTDHNIS